MTDATDALTRGRLTRAGLTRGLLCMVLAGFSLGCAQTRRTPFAAREDVANQDQVENRGLARSAAPLGDHDRTHECPIPGAVGNQRAHVIPNRPARGQGLRDGADLGRPRRHHRAGDYRPVPGQFLPTRLVLRLGRVGCPLSDIREDDVPQGVGDDKKGSQAPHQEVR